MHGFFHLLFRSNQKTSLWGLEWMQFEISPRRRKWLWCGTNETFYGYQTIISEYQFFIPFHESYSSDALVGISINNNYSTDIYLRINACKVISWINTSVKITGIVTYFILIIGLTILVFTIRGFHLYDASEMTRKIINC